MQLNSTFDWIGRGVTAVAGLLERLGLRDIDRVRIRSTFTPTAAHRPSRFPPGHFEEYGANRARETGAKVVVLGHTHRPALTRWGPTVYANAGCWTRPDFLGSFVTVRSRTVELWKVLAG